MIGILLELIALGLLVVGATGSGKTNFIFWLMNQLYQKGIFVRFWDFKGEARRLIRFWNEAVVFDLETLPFQWLEPVGNRLAYFISIISDIRREFELRPETYPLLWSIFERIERGMRPGDPWPSTEDLRRVIEHEAKEQHRENLYTIARFILTICAITGEQSKARKVPDIWNLFKIIGLDFVGIDVAIFRLIFGFHCTKLIMKAQEMGHTTALTSVDVIDEGSIAFGSELMNRYTTTISSVKRFMSMARFTGTAPIVGAQNLSQLDNFVKQNCGTIVVFRTPSVQDALEASQMLGMPPEDAQLLMRLKTGEGYARSIGWEQPVRFQAPLFNPMQS